MRAHEREVSELTLIPSRGGRFEVVVDDQLLFSKVRLGRHANAAEVLRAIETRQPVES